MGDHTPTRDFADGVLRELKRLQAWNDDQERRLRKQEVKMAIVMFIGSAITVIGGWAVSLLA